MVACRVCVLGFFTLLVSLTATDGALKEEDDVLVINGRADLEAATREFPLLLVEYYAPWCGHCKALAPDYAKAAHVLKSDDTPIRLAKCDATQATNKELAAQAGVQGFPTMKLFRGEVASEYTGGRASADIVHWMRKRAGPAFVELTNTADATEFAKRSGVRVVGFHDGDTEGAAARAMRSAAAAVEGVHFAVAGLDTGVRGAFAAPNGDSTTAVPAAGAAVLLLKDIDEPRAMLVPDTWTADAVREFVEAERVPLVQEFSQERATEIFSSDAQTHFLLFVDKGDAAHAAARSAFGAVARRFRRKSLHVIMPSDQTDVLAYFALEAAALPAAIIVTMDQGMRQYRMAPGKPFDEETLGTFEAAFHAGEVRPHLKSAPHVADDDDAVKSIVGDTFQKRVMDDPRDVLLKFYAPWCGHCKALAPKYQEVGRKLAKHADKVVVAMMDATENDVDHDKVNVEGFPTILLFKAGAKEEPIDFVGAREVSEILRFVRENAHHDITGKGGTSTSTGDRGGGGGSKKEEL